MTGKLKFYFHIGQPKTGTTAIQAFLNYNRENLAKNYKILYPNFDTHNYAFGMMREHSHYGILMNSKTDEDREVTVNRFLDVIDYCNRNGYNSLIISLECFDIKGMPELLYNIATLPAVETVIILYLRRQDLWAESAWKQWGHKIDDCISIYDYLRIRNFDWYSILKNWLAYFTPSQINIRPYEENFIGKDVTTDFLKTIGISSKDEFIIPPEKNNTTNYGFAREIVEILRLTRPSVSNADDHKFMDFLSDVLPDRYKKKDFSASYQILSPTERLAIIDKYEESNNKIAKMFFGDKRPKLFLDPAPDVNEKWKPFNGLTINNVVSVFMDIFYSQSQNIKSLQQEIEMMKQPTTFTNPFLKKNQAFVSIDFERIVRNILYKNDLPKIKIQRGVLWLYSNGNDPYFALPMSLIPNNPKVLGIEISVPAETFFQVFFSPDSNVGFEEKDSFKMQLPEGKCKVMLPVGVFNQNGMLRIDPGQIAGEYIIHEIEFGY
jgi:hypothetical protein